VQCKVDQECDFTRRSFLLDIEVHPRKLPLRRGNTSFAKPNVLYVSLVVDVEASKHLVDSLQCVRWRFIVSFVHIMQKFCFSLITIIFMCVVQWFCPFLIGWDLLESLPASWPQRIMKASITSSIQFFIDFPWNMSNECLFLKFFMFFQGTKTSTLKQIHDNYSPHSIWVHCMAHQTNLVVQTLSKLHMVICLENLLQTLHSYFAHSFKRHLEFPKLAKLMKTMGNKII